MYLKGIIYMLILLIGVINCTPYNRVVNGTSSHITKYPFVVSMRNDKGGHLCGASIIAPQYILTAAHCVDGRNPKDIQIQFANTQISVNGTNVVPIKRIITHENYSTIDSFANDIALLELSGRLIFNYKTLAPVTLPELNYEINQEPEGVLGVLVGWGRNETGGPIQINLQEVELKIYSDKECKERHDNVTTNHQLCGGVDEGYKGQCSGDSGGPLIYNNYIQLGIVSWSIKPCTRPPYPGVYTKVSHYIDWIYKNINQ